MRHEIVGGSVVALAVPALAIGCSKSPTGPSETGGGSTVTRITLGGNLSVPEGALFDVTIVANSVTALSSCDDFFDGATNGEFAYGPRCS